MENKKYALQQEELRLVAALSAVRTQLNEFTLISSLPTEILEYIFSICVFWLYDPRKQEHRLAWTQVCRKWRCISLNAARLWHFIDLCNARLASECLLRSASAPIHLISTSTWKMSAEDLLHVHASRIQSINVLLFPEDLEHLFYSCGPELPGLTSLSLKVPPVSSNSVLDIATRFPCLRSLTLRSVSIPWNMCSGLKYLSLRGLVAGCSPTLEQLLALLKTSPYIEELHLEHITPTPPDDSRSHPDPVPLDSLRELTIIAKAPWKIHVILSSVVFPPTTRMSIECSQIDSLHEIFPSTPATMYSDLYVQRILLERKGFYLFPPTTSAEFDAEPLISLQFQHSRVKCFLEGVATFFNVSEATILETDGDILLDHTQDILTFLDHIPALEIIRVPTRAPLTNAFLALANPVAQDILPCPRKRICLREIQSEVWDGVDEKDWLHFLCLLGESRRGAVKPLEFEFQNCRIQLSPDVCDTLAGFSRHA